MLRDTWEALFFFVPWENRQLFSGSQRRRRSSSLSTPSSLYRMLCQVSNERRWCVPSVSETRKVSSIHSLFFSPVPFMSSSESRVEIEKRKANIACHSDDSVSIQGNIQLRLWDYETASSLFLSVAACGKDSQISHNTLVSRLKHSSEPERFHVSSPQILSFPGSLNICFSAIEQSVELWPRYTRRNPSLRGKPISLQTIPTRRTSSDRQVPSSSHSLQYFSQ